MNKVKRPRQNFKNMYPSFKNPLKKNIKLHILFSCQLKNDWLKKRSFTNIMNSNNNTKNRRRYTPEEKKSVLDFIAEWKTKNKRGAQKKAAEHFGISTVTISSWMKASKPKRGRKPGSKKAAAPKTKPLAAAQPADLRRLAAVLEEIAELEAQTSKLDTLRAEAEELKNRLTAKQA